MRSPLLTLVAAVAAQKLLAQVGSSSGGHPCPPRLGPYEWVERDGAMVCVDRFGHRHIVMSKQDYEALRAKP